MTGAFEQAYTAWRKYHDDVAAFNARGNPYKQAAAERYAKSVYKLVVEPLAGTLPADAWDRAQAVARNHHEWIESL